MKKQHIDNHNTETTNATVDNAQLRPAAFRGKRLTTEQLHNILTTDNSQLPVCEQFDRAVQRQRYLFKICNTLDRHDEIHHQVDQLLHAPRGVHWLDNQNQQFKRHCPEPLLSTLIHLAEMDCLPDKHPGNISRRDIAGVETMVTHYETLVHDTIQQPMKTLSTLQPAALDDQQRYDWYRWCADLDTVLHELVNRIGQAQAFFTRETWQNILTLSPENASHTDLDMIAGFFTSTNQEQGI